MFRSNSSTLLTSAGSGLSDEAVKDLECIKKRRMKGLEDNVFMLQMPPCLFPGQLQGADQLQSSGVVPLTPSDALHLMKVSKLDKLGLAKTSLGTLKFASALCGGIVVVTPVLIMTLVGGRICTLVTMCSSTALFAALVSVASRRGPQEMFAITIAYGAILTISMGSRSWL